MEDTVKYIVRADDSGHRYLIEQSLEPEFEVWLKCDTTEEYKGFDFDTRRFSGQVAIILPRDMILASNAVTGEFAFVTPSKAEELGIAPP